MKSPKKRKYKTRQPKTPEPLLPVPSLDDLVPVVQSIMTFLAKKFKFSYYEEEDITQEAFIMAMEALDRWDRRRTIGGFLYVHIYKRLCNLKRKKYERRTLPCESCPLNAWVNKQCTAYEDKMDCKLYYNWCNRNIAKKSLASPDSYPISPSKNMRKPEMPVLRDEIMHDYKLAIAAMPPEVRAKFFSGKTLKEEDLEAIRENFYG